MTPTEMARVDSSRCEEERSDFVRRVLLEACPIGHSGNIADDFKVGEVVNVRRPMESGGSHFEHTVTDDLVESKPVNEELTKVYAERVRTCSHGVMRGHHCWQCGGAAKVEAS